MISAASIELRPPPLLAIGIAGHRSVGIDGENALAVAAALDALLRQLDAAFRTIVAAERTFFSGAQPTLRLVGMAAEGSSLLGARGAEIACVLNANVRSGPIRFYLSSKKLAKSSARSRKGAFAALMSTFPSAAFAFFTLAMPRP